MSVFPGTMSGSQQEQDQTDELCNLFSATLRSMAADALAVRQLSSLATLNDMTYKTRNGGENNHPNIHREEDKSIKDLRKLDEIVTAIEQKVGALREIVSEEKKALKKFESSLQQEAEDQAAVMIQMVKACQALEVAKQRDHDHHSPMRSSSTNSSSRRDSFDPRHTPPMRAQSRHTSNIPTPVRFHRVTHLELKGFSRNTLGRISAAGLPKKGSFRCSVSFKTPCVKWSATQLRPWAFEPVKRRSSLPSGLHLMSRTTFKATLYDYGR